MKLSVVILNYNVRYFLELCLQSVTEAIDDIDAEIIVVDNNSSDDSCSIVETLFPDVILIKNTNNLGFSKGNNIGVKAAKGEYVCILNPDTVVAEDTFVTLLEFADSKTDLGILGCQLIDGKGNFLPESKRNIPKPYVAFQKMLGNGSQYYNNLDEEAIGKVDVLVGAFMLLKKEVYHSVSGFDEDYFMYGEDIDLSYKVSKTHTNYYYGQTSVLHFKGESTLKDKNYLKRFYGAMHIFYKKHFKRNIIFNTVVFTGIKLAYLIKKSDPIAITKPQQTQIFSSRDLKTLKSKLTQQIKVYTDLNLIEDHSLIILDAEMFSYKTILKTMKTNAKNKSLTYRILPKKSNFSLGSDSAISQGEVIKF
ncbi:glycosyltransferase family 2 protein [Winogradskyella immobilis]|uniref:Glycosyltransferase family 2 protein n=1 Tax=Winogradskyella immobilis TaxID=2816852 RepID=A0ABS8ERH2_9FLAO|nr:glycosyltransferase family 2 protein [Winogradskyella immobilis]MCC1485135.1 glycosyltransferase family 2 protein [Winogradskyella immobilis]MCG0017227.1 glycosyltransferase family 2 protein [Winogradskyella immobilis]